jgi:hypothetical protein
MIPVKKVPQERKTQESGGFLQELPTYHDGMGTISTLGMGTISTLTDPPPIQSPEDGPNISINPPPIKSLPEKHCVISSLTPNSPTWTIHNYKQNTNNANDGTALSTSPDPPINDNATLSPDNDT